MLGVSAAQSGAVESGGEGDGEGLGRFLKEK